MIASFWRPTTSPPITIPLAWLRLCSVTPTCCRLACGPLPTPVRARPVAAFNSIAGVEAGASVPDTAQASPIGCYREDDNDQYTHSPISVSVLQLRRGNDARLRRSCPRADRRRIGQRRTHH